MLLRRIGGGPSLTGTYHVGNKVSEDKDVEDVVNR
jgi:hypothetical protein